MDEEKNVVVYRVPAHNDIDGAHFYHDFKMVKCLLIRIIEPFSSYLPWVLSFSSLVTKV